MTTSRNLSDRVLSIRNLNISFDTASGTVRSHTAIAKAYQNLPRVAQVEGGVIEQAVAQTRADNRTERTVEKDRLRDTLGKPLALDEVIEKTGGNQNGQRPGEAIVADLPPQARDSEKYGIEIPNDR